MGVGHGQDNQHTLFDSGWSKCQFKQLRANSVQRISVWDMFLIWAGKNRDETTVNCLQRHLWTLSCVQMNEKKIIIIL